MAALICTATGRSGGTGGPPSPPAPTSLPGPINAATGWHVLDTLAQGPRADRLSPRRYRSSVPGGSRGLSHVSSFSCDEPVSCRCRMASVDFRTRKIRRHQIAPPGRNMCFDFAKFIPPVRGLGLDHRWLVLALGPQLFHWVCDTCSRSYSLFVMVRHSLTPKFGLNR